MLRSPEGWGDLAQLVDVLDADSPGHIAVLAA